MNYNFDHNSRTMLVKITFDIPNKRLYFSLSFHIGVIVIINLILYCCDFKTYFLTFIF